MPDESSGTARSRFPLPLYLNQKYVFDVLAMMEGGFSQIEAVTSRTTGEHEKSGGLSGEVGFKNVFGLLSVSLGGERKARELSGQQTEVSSERVHTPNSLFDRMRQRLFDEGLVHSSLTGEATSAEGFVEMTMRLEKNPLLETLETMVSLTRMAAIFEAPPAAPSSRKQSHRQMPASPTAQMLQQMEDMLTQLTTGEVIDIVATPITEDAPAVVLTLDLAYAADRSLSDLIDGEYSVFGKITRFIPAGSDETINLLRKTTLGNLQAASLGELAAALEDVQAEGIVLPEFRTEIVPPVVQILPIAVFA
jgi:hypothetical protein